MSTSYDRRQAAGNWPCRGRWSPEGLPTWYVELLGIVAGSATAWRNDTGVAPLDPRFNPRCGSGPVSLWRSRMSDSLSPEFQPAPRAPKGMQYDIVPVGRHDVEIVRADRQPVPWRISETNPTGECLTLRLRAGANYAFIIQDFPADLPWLRWHLANAAGIHANQCIPDELVGRTVTVIVEHVQTRAGTMRAVVKQWVPVSPAAKNSSSTAKPAANQAAGRLSRNAVKQHVQQEDGIPF